jgi:hypothetical protein
MPSILHIGNAQACRGKKGSGTELGKLLRSCFFAEICRDSKTLDAKIAKPLESG